MRLLEVWHFDATVLQTFVLVVFCALCLSGWSILTVVPAAACRPNQTEERGRGRVEVSVMQLVPALGSDEFVAKVCAHIDVSQEMNNAQVLIERGGGAEREWKHEELRTIEASRDSYI